MTAALAATAPYEVIGTSNDRDWHSRRRLGVGASEAAIMLGQHPRYGEGGPAELWCWKTGRVEPESLDELENVQWGHRMEALIIEAYSETRYAGRSVRRSGEQLRSRAHPWALATLDAWTQHPEFGRVPFEAKNVGSYQAERWVDGVPIEMHWQLQQQMLVTGAPIASIAACVGGNALWWEDVPRSDAAQELLIECGARFWRSVVSDVVPLHVPTLRSVKALYPAGFEGGVIQLPGSEWPALDARLGEIKAQQSKLGKERDAIEARLKDAIGDHEIGVFDDGVAYTHRTQQRAAITIAACEFKVLRRKAPKGER
jgi:putative phage-type endonuclease